MCVCMFHSKRIKHIRLFSCYPPDSIPHEVPQVLINREQLPHLNFDVELLGDCDVIVNELCHRLGGDFEQLCYNTVRLCEITEKPPRLTELSPSEALPASSNAAREEQKQQRTDSVATPADETEGSNVTETAASNVVPQEPCPNAQHASGGTSEPSDLPAGDAPIEEATEVQSQTSNFEFRRRCWMSRINRSPISKRLESKLSLKAVLTFFGTVWQNHLRAMLNISDIEY